MELLPELKERAERIAGQWNGKTPSGEEKAQCAKDILEKIEELEKLVEELDQY